METVQRKLVQEREKNLSQEPLARIVEKIQDSENKWQALTKEMGGIEEVINQQRELKKKYDEKAIEKKNQENECQRWDLLNNIIGSANGQEFRKFAQGLTLDRLLVLSNKHLNKLSGRYELNRNGSYSLGLEIIDTFQGNIRRSINTLSGGESFIVSLSMALGLSDLASRRTKVESLFLDEGFGFLDQETLDIALSVLENIKDNGKIIGIVSHIEMLKERIPVQIQVKKEAAGFSSISVIS